MRCVFAFSLCTALMVCTTACSAAEPECRGFAFYPDGAHIAAVYSSRDSSFIYTISVKTGFAARLTKATTGIEGLPSFSPDGKLMAYSYSPTANAHTRIVVANIDGSERYSWATTGASDLRPLFLPDNQHLIFARAGYYGNYSPLARPAMHEWNFYVSDLDGSNVRQITDQQFYYVSRASVSPDGKSMMFVSKEESSDLIEIYSLMQPPEPKILIRSPIEVGRGEALVADAMYMPDGRSILFNAATNGHWGHYDYDIYLMDLKSRKVDRLTNAIGFAYGLQASCDGKTAIFMRDSSHTLRQKTEIFLLDMATRSLTPLRVTGIQGER